MSGGGNRKKSGKTQGWEEAGAEFYQESYPTDAELDVLQRDPQHLATLLPSKQTRATTIRIRQTDTRSIRRQTTERHGTTHRKASTLVDVSMLPDLSQDISTEQAMWEEIMQIKAMPVPMAQKKEMKARIQNEPNLRLQGFEQFKWRRRKVWRQFQTRLRESLTKMELWRSALKKIEGNFGTGVVAYFLFVKWLLFLNAFIFLLVFVFVVLPTILFTKNSDNGSCDETNANTSVCCSAIYFGEGRVDFGALDLVQGTGAMERTYLFYGFYPNVVFDVYEGFYYNLPLAYVLVAAGYFLVSLVAIVVSAAKGFKERLVEGEGQFYQYCNLVFGGWDFCIRNQKSAATKHKAIFNEIKGLLETERLEEERQNRTKEERIKLLLLRGFLNVLVVSVLAACGTGIYFVFDFSTTKLKEISDLNGNQTVTFVGNNSTNSLEGLFYEFLPSICIVIMNLIVPFVFKFLIAFEHYSPIFEIRLTLVRTVLLRLSSLIVLYASLYGKISCELEETDTCSSSKCNTPLCWETYVGQQIYKLFITDFATNLLVTFAINFPRALIAKHSENRFAKFIGEQNFDLPKHVLDIIYSQTLCWIGTFYMPLLPLLCTVAFFLIFYIKKFACLVNCTPHSTIYRASRSNSMFMVVTLVSYTICGVLPLAYAVSELLPSRSCGPFRDLRTVWQEVSEAFLKTPKFLQDAVSFLSTAGFAVPLFIVLILLLYYFTAVNSANRHMVLVLKNQLVLEGHDKQFLLNRLSMFIRQQQEQQKRLRRAEMVQEGGDRHAASN